MNPAFAAAVVALFLAGCAGSPLRLSDDSPQQLVATPTRDQLVGSYSWGDGMGANETLELRKDGTYRRTLLPHLDNSTLDLFGLWQTQGPYIFFYAKDGTYNEPGAHLTYAEAFFYQGKPAFARAQDVKRGRVHHWWVYTWEGPL